MFPFFTFWFQFCWREVDAIYLARFSVFGAAVLSSLIPFVLQHMLSPRTINRCCRLLLPWCYMQFYATHIFMNQQSALVLCCWSCWHLRLRLFPSLDLMSPRTINRHLLLRLMLHTVLCQLQCSFFLVVSAIAIHFALRRTATFAIVFSFAPICNMRCSI